ncbi:MAG: putative membrane protein [Candidatus Gottesmanbacteria bacterium GW2011_GWC2_39_8]|uniref:Putative membrane protein n=1 Tax=Candidatus Gottesmanbacteria bacterium GW2011_GWC2_39_8 TaxID=1618450 RepID=A0A0G0SHC5_9BACT|nr:MAG: putative membrane protein [Candidatus Gottesmanbacteria bacterium GW2011_GWC2_39_8]
MLLNFAILSFLLFSIFLLSQNLQKYISLFFYLLIGNKKISSSLLVIILLPGTIIHELSHLIMALILRVHTGELTIMPKFGENGEILAGSLEIGNTDPFRRTLIGLAPIIVGLALIFFLNNLIGQIGLNWSNWTNLIIYYLFFTVSTSMFSSKKDLESLVIAGPIMVVLVYILYNFGVRITLSENLIQTLNPIIVKLNWGLLKAGILDLLIFSIIRIPVFFLRKALKN